VAYPKLRNFLYDRTSEEKEEVEQASSGELFPRSRRHDTLLLISEHKHDIASQDGDRNKKILDPAVYISNESEGWKSHSPILYLLL